MIFTRKAVVTEIIEDSADQMEIEIELGGERCRALSLTEFTGTLGVGDEIIVNTTAAQLNLGSGGYHFVLWNLENDEISGSGSGHLMKLRYTPLQRAAISAEEFDSPYHDVLRDARDLDGQPVIACGLHSQLLPIVATLRKTAPDLRLAYVMTDGGALPAGYSRTVRWLREKGHLHTVISAGQAFGGDLEAVNTYSALMAARKAVSADITIVAMGPGIAGTGTVLGHTGMEQGAIINAVHSLGGRPVAPLRIGMADARPRHRGLSHHSVSALTLGALAPALVAVPNLQGSLAHVGKAVADELGESGIAVRHEVRTANTGAVPSALAEIEEAGGPAASTMGRGFDEEPAFFLAAGAAAIVAGDIVKKG